MTSKLSMNPTLTSGAIAPIPTTVALETICLHLKARQVTALSNTSVSVSGEPAETFNSRRHGCLPTENRRGRA